MLRTIVYPHAPIHAALALCLLLLPGLAVSTAHAQPIGTRHNTDLDFSQFSSYSWSVPDNIGESRDADDPLRRNSPLDLAVRAAIEGALAEKGLRREARRADLVLSYEAVLGDQVATEDSRSNVPISAEELAGVPPTRQGTMVITLQLPDGTFAWSGVGRQKGQSVDNVDELIKRASKLAVRIASRYPPGSSRR